MMLSQSRASAALYFAQNRGHQVSLLGGAHLAVANDVYQPHHLLMPLWPEQFGLEDHGDYQNSRTDRERSASNNTGQPPEPRRART
jgi:hypothetical protein